MEGGRGRGRRGGGRGRRSKLKREDNAEVEPGRDGFLSKTRTADSRGSPPMRDLSILVVDNNGLKPLKELWDYENNHIPNGLPLRIALANVQATMVQRGYYILSTRRR